ncbi:transposase [Halioxenophilus sp. WMMB6]|uniref:transposase n=1 Tax=Halioxenophilus sp. WMMB6 TaxID=3073815 RepID=UPI00295E5A9B|nr:transposase [Halioxenophilus sp. WMMB6]
MPTARHSLRLPHYNYSQGGAYFITLCADQRRCLFGEVVNGEMALGHWGRVVAEQWLLSEQMRAEISLDYWVIMPNHFHGIVHIENGEASEGTARTRLQARSLGALVAGFKAAVTRQINQLGGTSGVKVWQRNYWERVVRDEQELTALREYIQNNPARWQLDKLFVG